MAWGGRGAVKLLEADPGRGALLLERLARDRDLERVPAHEALTAAAAVLRLLHVAPPPGLRTLADLAGRWRDELPRPWRGLGRPGRSDLVAAAAATCAELAADPGGPVLLHGDLHYGNVLAGVLPGWTAIDPKPLAGDAGFDLVPLLRNRWAEVIAAGDAATAVRRRLDHLCDGAGLDRERARRWSQARAVDDALWGQRHDEPAFAAVAWAVAAALQRTGPRPGQR